MAPIRQPIKLIWQAHIRRLNLPLFHNLTIRALNILVEPMIIINIHKIIVNIHTIIDFSIDKLPALFV